jgi:hypothetical protein
MRTTFLAVLCLLIASTCVPAQQPAPGPAKTKTSPRSDRPAAAAGEQVREFQSDIRVHPDGSLTVTETIVVEAQGKEILHGIYRDFPTRYGALLQGKTVVPFAVVEVLRDGAAESYHIENERNGTRIYLGKADTLLTPGMHRFVLTYKTSRQLGYTETRDELYWNVTGNGWSLPIARASATVSLPEGVPAAQITTLAYTGAQGLQGKDYTASIDPTGKVSFQTTRPLAAREGLTIVVAWPKGFVAEPSPAQRWTYFLQDDAPALVVLGGLVLLALIYLVQHLRVGPVPAPGEIVPQETPPEGLSAAAARYNWRMGFDRTCLAAAVVDMAVKGYLQIKEEQPYRYALERVPDAKPDHLSEDERQLGASLFRLGDRIDVQNTNHATFQAALAGLKQTLAGTYKNRTFIRHGAVFGIGIACSLAILVAAALLGLSQGSPEIAFLLLWLTIWTVGVTALGIPTWAAWKTARRGIGKAPRFSAGCLTAIAIPFFVAEVVGLGFLAWVGSLLLPVAFLALFGVNLFFFLHWLKVPTEEGRRLMDQIEGFRMHLAAGRQELAQAEDADQAARWFEKYLAYALALVVEREWAAKFAGVIGRAAATPRSRQTYNPLWYNGPFSGRAGDGAFVSALGASFSSAIASASTAPGSSSGMGDGGSSGGGGGGGGGGGW